MVNIMQYKVIISYCKQPSGALIKVKISLSYRQMLYITSWLYVTTGGHCFP